MLNKTKTIFILIQIVTFSLTLANVIEKKCTSNSDCDTENECCLFPIEYPTFQPASVGTCQKYLTENQNCSWISSTCGCKPGLQCYISYFNQYCKKKEQ